MKMYIFVFVLSLLSFLNGCSIEEPSTSPTNNSGQKGGISLKFNSTEIPENVCGVIARLTREGYDPIVDSLNLLTSTSAELLLVEIPVGVWHLIIDAIDDDSTIVYSGEADIEVQEGTTTNIYLTLYPTVNGVGSIYIYVTWGTSGYNWFDHFGNPILLKSGNIFDKFGVGHTYILKDAEQYKMYYTGQSDNSITYVYLATSVDGLSWTKYSDIPILAPGNSGSWDAGRCAAGPVIKENGIYKMYYQSFANVNDPWAIGLATSSDGINWTKNPLPILMGGTWDRRLRPSEIIKIGTVYYLYYTGFSYAYDGEIGLATSIDGSNWTKYPNNPIMVPEENWEAGSIGFPSIHYENGYYNMVYQSYISGDNGFGFAKSTDGIIWQKDNSNPFFTSDNTINNLLKIGWPNYRKFEDEYRIYYTGFAYEGADWTICVARKFIY